MAKAHARANDTPLQPLPCSHAIGEMLPKDAVVIDETISSGAGPALAPAQRRSAELLWPARRRHRLGPAGGARRQARAAGAAGGGARRRRQRHVHLPGAVDRGARPHRRRVRHPQQHAPIASSSSACVRSAAPPRRSTAIVGMELVDPPIDYVGLARSLGSRGRARHHRSRGHRPRRARTQERRAAADRCADRPRLAMRSLSARSPELQRHVGEDLVLLGLRLGLVFGVEIFERAFAEIGRGRIMTRMKRVGRSAAAWANTGSGPLSYQAPPGP